MIIQRVADFEAYLTCRIPEKLVHLFLFVVPIALGSYVPICYLLGRPLPFGLPNELAFAAPVVALAFALVAGATWRFGVRHHHSTGS